MTREAAITALIQAARPIAAAAADLLASTRDASSIWEMPAAMSITAGDLRGLEEALFQLDAAPVGDSTVAEREQQP